MSDVESLYNYILTCKECKSHEWNIYMDSPKSDEATPISVQCAECGLVVYDFSEGLSVKFTKD